MLGFIGFLLLLFFIFYVVLPLAKFGWKIYRAKKNWDDQMNQFRRAAEGRRDAWGRPAEPETPHHKKKIARDVGEYVAFEEISVETSEETTDKKTVEKETFTSEEQIEDVSWEDIK